jgi:hypothetical protein
MFGMSCGEGCDDLKDMCGAESVLGVDERDLIQ